MTLTVIAHIWKWHTIYTNLNPKLKGYSRKQKCDKNVFVDANMPF